MAPHLADAPRLAPPPLAPPDATVLGLAPGASPPVAADGFPNVAHGAFETLSQEAVDATPLDAQSAPTSAGMPGQSEGTAPNFPDPTRLAPRPAETANATPLDAQSAPTPAGMPGQSQGTAPDFPDPTRLAPQPAYPEATPFSTPPRPQPPAATGAPQTRRGPAGFEPTRLALPPHVVPDPAPDWPPQDGWTAPIAAPEPAPRPRPRRRIELPVRQRHYSFSLIAFADAMFQLLIFFMLASNLSTFSLLTISRGGGPGGGGAAGEAQAAALPAPGPGQTAIWTLSRDGVTAGGQRFDLAQITRLAEGARAAGTGQVLLVTRSGAEVQGVVRVLEALARNGITSVQIAAPQLATAGGAP